MRICADFAETRTHGVDRTYGLRIETKWRIRE
jgi:hypothetical protein